MQNDRGVKLGAACGIVATILFGIGFFVVAPKPPQADEGALAFAAYFTDHQDRVQAAVAVVAVSTFFLVWFIGTLRAVLSRAEAGDGRLAGISFAGGLVSAGFFVVALTALAVAAYRPGEVDPNLTRSLNDAALLSAAPIAGGATALFGAAACVIYRFGGMARWAGTVAALAAFVQPLALTGVFTDSGAFAPDGAVGLFAPVAGLAIGTIALAIAMMRGGAPASASS